MKPFISHTTAAMLWEIPYLHVVLGYQSYEAIKTAEPRRHVTYPSESQRVRRIAEHAHVTSQSLPKKALTTSKEGQRIASPELVFLELANELDFHHTVLLGLQLCSTGLKKSKEPLATVATIGRLLEQAKGHAGYRAAATALQYLTDRSASIMESLLYMLLTLPPYYGGFGLKGAVLNHRISLSGKQTSLSKDFVIVDLYWRNEGLVVEYDSASFHANANNWAKDTRRLTAIENLGYKTLSITTPQLYNKQAFEEVASVIAKHLHKRIRINSNRFSEQHKALRSLLPRLSSHVL